ncbi:hypothetical protein [Aquamicrobium ahrensii]|uniref:Uncharacterized protein n=1 Tax=Aquamicrobium ahrensii TaxID=469551 RepID=A0ABV2KH18_9HYPH
MQPSIAGIIVCAVIILFVRLMRWSMIVAFMASLAFGATAIGTLSSLGGSSPQIYTVFAALLLTTAVARKGIWRDLAAVFSRIGAASVIVVLMFHALIGAVLFPRLFAGQTSVFIASRTSRGVYETALGPSSANVTQTAYFTLGILVFVALCLLLRRRETLLDVKRGFFLWFGLHTAMGMLDLAGKMAGAGDVLAPIRTASYAMLTLTMEGGFWRIAGSYSEASTFGAVSLAGLAFSYTYWRRTNSRFAAAIAAALFLLLLLSTSTTAYVGLALLGVPVALSLARSLVSAKPNLQDVLLVVLMALLCLVVMAVSLYNAQFFEPLVRLIDQMVTHKMSSASGQERAYWNYKSLQAFFDTNGLGIGLGSSRASSWPIAVLSQLGVVGATLIAMLLAALVWPRGRSRQPFDAEADAIMASARASALAVLLAASLAGGLADPGMGFFVPLAVVMACSARIWAAAPPRGLAIDRSGPPFPVSG